MVEIITIVAGIVAGLGTVATTGYKCYESYKDQRNRERTEQVQTCNHGDHRENMLESIVIRDANKRPSADSDTSYDITINFHSHDEKE